MTISSYIGYDKQRYRKLANKRIRKKLPINLEQFIALLGDEETAKTKFVELPCWLEQHKFDTEGLYPVKWWKEELKKMKEELK